jgi:hypothetical protein
VDEVQSSGEWGIATFPAASYTTLTIAYLESFKLAPKYELAFKTWKQDSRIYLKVELFK